MSLRFGLIDTTFERKVADAEPADPPLPVLKTEPLKGIWTGNNNLGIRRSFEPDARQRQSVIMLPEMGFPQVWTIALGIVGFPSGLFNGFNVRGILEFGVGGATDVIEVDWINGVQLSLTMNALNVIAEFSDLDIDTEGQGLELVVTLARGSRPGGSQRPVVTLAENIAMVATTGDSGLIEIPKFATRVCAVPTTATAAAIAAFYSGTTLLTLRSGNLAGHATVALSGLELASLRGADVTGQARFARLFNTGAVPYFATIYAELAA